MPFETPGQTTPKEFKDPPASRHYRAADGSFVPSVTTIIGVLSKDGLVEWANSLGFKQVRYKEHLNDLAKAGTLFHSHVESMLLHGKEADETGYTDQQKRDAFAALFHWRSWRKQYEVGRVMVEKPLISAIHGYAGTIDCVAELNGQPVLLDWKSSKTAYLSHAIQVTAYQNLIRENWGQNLTAAIVVCPRIGGGFSEWRIEPDERMEELFDLFLKAKALYDALHRNKKWENGLI